MNKKTAFFVYLTCFCLHAPSSYADELYKAWLEGVQEVPAVATDSSGMILLRLDENETSIDIQLHVYEGVGITQAHIHCAPTGLNGPVVVFLAGNHMAGLDVDGKWISNARITDSSIVNDTCGASLSELADALRTGNAYVNVHSLQAPSGEIRGQIFPTGNIPVRNFPFP